MAGMLLTMIEGFATREGTQRFSERFNGLRQTGHFRQPNHVHGPAELSFSSIGLGTYLGEPDEAGDQLYTQAIGTALRSGINVLDTAINYRHQHSERNIGKALEAKIESGEIQRDEVIVCTKAGYLSFDGSVPADPRGYFVREYVDSGVIKPAEIAGSMHCMAPSYLENQLERSSRNIGLKTIDVFYLHNPESQLGDVPREEFRNRMKAAFCAMEKFVKEGKIRWYGIASWNSFRVTESDQAFISLAKCVELAKAAGGDNHHFRFVQMPFNLGMPEAYGLPSQVSGHEHIPPLQFLREHGIAGVASASLHQGQLTHDLPDWLAEKIGMSNDSERALQFARSAPGIITALVGMGRPGHVLENIKAAQTAPLTAETFAQLFPTD
jgi:aryl-alcohol dehydrogenase-like predicted oxidoreductase